MTTVFLPPDIWTNLNIATQIPAGSEMIFQNTSTSEVLLYEKTDLPDFSSDSGVVTSTLKDNYAFAKVDTGSLDIWAKPVGTNAATLFLVKDAAPIIRNYYVFNTGGSTTERCVPSTPWSCSEEFFCSFTWVPDGGVNTGTHCIFSNGASLTETSFVVDFEGGSIFSDGQVILTEDDDRTTTFDIPTGFDWSQPHRWTVYRDDNYGMGVAIDGEEIGYQSFFNSVWDIERFFCRSDFADAFDYLKGRVWNVYFELRDSTGGDKLYYWKINDGSGISLLNVAPISDVNQMTIENFGDNWIMG